MGVGNAAEADVGPSMDEVLSEDQDFDFIAKVLYNHPAIQAVMANNV